MSNSNQMNLDEQKNFVRKFITDKPGYLKKSPYRVSSKTGIDVEICRIIQQEMRKLSRENGQLEDNSKDEKVYRKKKWQLPNGEWRESIEYRKNQDDYIKFKEDILNNIFSHSPIREEIIYEDTSDQLPVALEIALPDIHIGKEPIKETAETVRKAVESLMKSASGMNIEKIIFPIGNDLLNTDSLAYVTTKGTPQFDYDEWQQTFRAAWQILVDTTYYLSQFAKVNLIVVQGNHDYERSFYIGEVLKAYFNNDANVSVDNGFHPRKYIKYGTNLLMFTHGDKEPVQDLPLIMATEKPREFAQCKYREIHCGHLHKEKMNEYRKIKVRFLPSLCKTDAWHKAKGYSHLRCVQALIWNKLEGFSGMIQKNLE